MVLNQLSHRFHEKVNVGEAHEVGFHFGDDIIASFAYEKCRETVNPLEFPLHSIYVKKIRAKPVKINNTSRVIRQSGHGTEDTLFSAENVLFIFFK